MLRSFFLIFFLCQYLSTTSSSTPKLSEYGLRWSNLANFISSQTSIHRQYYVNTLRLVVENVSQELFISTICLSSLEILLNGLETNDQLTTKCKIFKKFHN